MRSNGPLANKEVAIGGHGWPWVAMKFAAIEGRWHDEQPAGEVLIAIPDPAAETNHYEVKIPVLGSLIASMSFTSKEVGLTDFPPQDRPPVVIPFFTFRIMVGCGLIMLAIAWLGSYLSLRNRIERNRFVLWLVFLSFPLPFISILTGWYTIALANRRRNDAVPDGARGGDFARRFLRHLHAHLRFRHFLHL